MRRTAMIQEGAGLDAFAGEYQTRPSLIRQQVRVQGEERDYETSLGDYKEVAGGYLPYSFESGTKGSPFKQKVSIEKMEVNVPLSGARFEPPPPPGTPELKQGQPADASQKTPMKP